MSKTPETIASITSRIRNYLDFISSLGFKGVDCSAKTLERLRSWGEEPVKTAETLADIAGELKHCRRCRLSRPGRHPVMGAGNPNAGLMFVGGWPEPEDAEFGKPYSGKAGELLTRIIQAMELSREEVYISHVLKCCPPPDGEPEAEDIRICCGFVRQEIDLVKPGVICALGEVAARALLDTRASWAELCGRFHSYRHIDVMPTFSPAYLLAHPAAKRETWDALKRILQKLSAPY